MQYVKIQLMVYFQQMRWFCLESMCVLRLPSSLCWLSLGLCISLIVVHDLAHMKSAMPVFTTWWRLDFRETDNILFIIYLSLITDFRRSSIHGQNCSSWGFSESKVSTLDTSRNEWNKPDPVTLQNAWLHHMSQACVVAYLEGRLISNDFQVVAVSLLVSRYNKPEVSRVNSPSKCTSDRLTFQPCDHPSCMGLQNEYASQVCCSTPANQHNHPWNPQTVKIVSCQVLLQTAMPWFSLWYTCSCRGQECCSCLLCMLYSVTFTVKACMNLKESPHSTFNCLQWALRYTLTMWVWLKCLQKDMGEKFTSSRVWWKYTRPGGDSAVFDIQIAHT